MNLIDRDKNLVWHPFTQAQTAPELIAMKKGNGAYLYDEGGWRYLDLISSWWVNIHGHANPKIASAIYEQARALEHVIFAGVTHEPAVRLCEELQKILPVEFSKYFFSDNGSTATEIALKMAYQYWRNIGQCEKTIFLSFKGGYHGDTVGAMSVGAGSSYHAQFKKLFFKVLLLDYPDYWQNCEDIEQKEQASLKQLEEYLSQYGNKIAAIILEPLVQGASGMRMCRASFLQQVINKVRACGILVIFDEVMTGFCRLGSYFAFEQLNIIPDLLCLSKALTGGFLPLALTVTQEYIYEAFLSESIDKAFLHGHSYTANPLACSAALASLELLASENCQNSIKNINITHKAELAKLSASCELVEKVRIQGTIAAFDVKNAKTLMPQFLKHGLLLRPLGDTIYILPPYCIETSDLQQAYEKILMIIK